MPYLIKQAEVSGLVGSSAMQARWPSLEMRCLVIEGRTALMLAEVGLGAMDVIAPLRRLGVTGALRLRNETIVPLRTRLVEAGYRPDDVTDVFVSHLDPGLTGGLFDFPKARVHTLPMQSSLCSSTLRRCLPTPERLTIPEGRTVRWHGFETLTLRFEELECRLLALPGFGSDRCALLLPCATGWLVFLGGSVSQVNDIRTGTFRKRLFHTLTSEKPFSRLQTELCFERMFRDPTAGANVVASFGPREQLLTRDTVPLVLPDL